VVSTYGSLEETREPIRLGDKAGKTAFSAPMVRDSCPPKPFGSVSNKFYSCSVPIKKVKQPLSVTHPELAKEANGWDTSKITAGSGKKMSWKCPLGHLYESVVVSRAGATQTNCPVCSGNKVLPGFNDFASKFPEIAKQANGWDPTQFSSNSNYRKEWRCSQGHIWITAIASRARGSGCPYCSGQKVMAGFNDLLFLNPELAAQASGWDPSSVAPQSNINREWKCAQGHIWNSKPADRHRGNGCPVCSGQKTLTGFNDIETLFPELAKEANGWDPKVVGPGSKKKLSWKCSLGHIWEAVVYSRKSGNGCAVCAGHQIQIGFNDLATLNPDLAKEANGWDPKTITLGNGNLMPWKCRLGHEWKAPVARRNAGSGCPICAGQKVEKGFNDLLFLNPELAAEAYGWDPSSTTISSDRIEEWVCPLGHIYKAAVKQRTRGDRCPVCAGKQIVVGFNDLATTDPLIAREAFGWNPQTITRGSTSKKQKWKCAKGHIYEATPAERTRSDGKNSGCGICSSKIVLAGYNDLKSRFPEIASEANGWDPATITYASGKMKSWKCKEGHTWKAIVSSRRVSGCPTCHIGGYDPNQKGYLYFLQHQQWQMFQIGITNFPEQRLNTHRSAGWIEIELRGPMDGHLTQQWETAILRMLKAKGADLSNSKIAGKFDGFSEAWSKSTFEAKSIKELMRLTEEFEEDKKTH
jgi:tRNA(Arg) A34 adenosine deaminase TadA